MDTLLETLSFIGSNLPFIGEKTLEHISLVGLAVGLAVLTGVPIGIAITRAGRPPMRCSTSRRS